jgi:hypothetical protein
MEVVVIDGQGGGIGKNIIQILKANISNIFIIGVGTNSIATNNLKKGGADVIATGENAVIYNVRKANIIIGPIGICFSNSMYGEISPAMANAVTESAALKYLIPVSKCNAKVTGVISKPINEYIDEVVMLVKEFIEKK